MDWPPNSPDLNPIENVWGYIKKKLDGFYFDSKEACFAAVERHWIPDKLKTVTPHISIFLMKLASEMHTKKY